MNFTIREYNTESDSESFAKLSFETLVSIRGLPPETSREDFYDWAKDWLNNFIEQLELNKIFIVEDNNGEYAGHIWISLEEELLPWEFNKNFWIQNITIEKKFRNLRLGTKLMNYAEDWIKKQKSNCIGLHVNIESEVAISLYRKFRYTEYKTQYIKYLNLAPQDVSLLMKPDKEVYIKHINTSVELDSIQTILFNAFNLKLRNQAKKNIIQSNFDKYFDFLKNNISEYQIFKILYQNDKICGYFIISIAEWRYHECIIIKDIGFNMDSCEEDVLQKVYNFIEEWTINQNIYYIQIVLSNKQINLINLFKENDFEIIGYFMHKRIL